MSNRERFALTGWRQPVPDIFVSLIQSDFVGDEHGNFEAVVRNGDRLEHWFRDNSAGHVWRLAGDVVPAGVMGAGCLIQSDFADGDHGNFEVVVPMADGRGGMDLVHWFHNNVDVSLPWERGQTVAFGVSGPGCLIQSDFADGDHGNFEVVVPMADGRGGMDLVHWFHNNVDVSLPWERGQTVAFGVAGPGCLIQSDFADGDHGNFEVVVPMPDGRGGMDLVHWFHNNVDVSLPWERGQTVAFGVAGPGCLIQSDFADEDHGNFEVVVPVPWGDGHQLRHYFHNSVDVALPWERGQFVTDSANGWACLISSDYAQDHRNFEVLAEECTRSVIGYFHPNEDVAAPWLRNGLLRGEPYPVRIAGARQICQLTGEYDRTGWDGNGDTPLAHNRTRSAYGIIGTDLGVSFPHRERTYFLFGDTLRVDQPDDWDNLDVIAYTQDTTPANGLDLAFFHEPPRISDGISQRGFEVPLDGVSAGDHWYAFFSTDHRRYGDSEVMGRSVLTRCDDDGFAFRYVRDLSRHKFINVSVQRGNLDGHASDSVGLPVGTDVLWIWGSGRYRSSDVYLAVIPFAQLEPGPFDVRYFSGTRSSPSWSRSEDDATPLFTGGAVGELSVRWQPVLQRYLATFNSDNFRGIHLHHASTPWGPWSQQPLMLFDPMFLQDPADPCSGDGYGRILHVPWNERKCDHVQDDMFGHWRENEPGAEYGAYQISNLTGSRNGGADLYFVMSSWNPYQSHLMTAFLDPALLA